VPSLSAPGFCSVYGSFNAGPLDLSGFGYTADGTSKAAIEVVAVRRHLFARPTPALLATSVRSTLSCTCLGA